MLWLFLVLFVVFAIGGGLWARRRVQGITTVYRGVARRRGGRVERTAFGVPRLHLDEGGLPMILGWIPSAGEEPERTVVEFRVRAPGLASWILRSADVPAPEPGEAFTRITVEGRLRKRYRVAVQGNGDSVRKLLEGPLRESLLTWSSAPGIEIRVGSWTERPRSWERSGEEPGTPVEVSLRSAAPDPDSLLRLVDLSRTLRAALGSS